MLVLKQSVPVENAKDVCILEKSNNGDKELSFTIAIKDSAYPYIAEEVSIELQEDEYYVIKSIEKRGDIATVTCRLDLDDFRAGGILEYSKEETLSQCMDFCLTGTGWTVQGAVAVPGKKLNELDTGNVLDLMRVAQENYGVVFKYNTRKKVVSVVFPQSGDNKGAYLTEELNLQDLSDRRDSYSLCTRLIPVGVDGLTIESVNDGKNYVENFSYTNKVITKVWKDERYTIAQNLKDAAIEYLKRVAYPTRVYDGQVINLAEIDEKYSGLEFRVGDVITLIDAQSGIRTEYEIVTHRRYPFEPERDTVEINAAAESYQSVIKGLTDTSQKMFVSNRKKISEVIQTVDGMYLRVNDTYTRGETENLLESQIQIEADRIELIISEQQATINGNTQRITEAEAELLIQAEQLSMTVQKDGIISAINLTPETTKISANHVELSGYVSFASLDSELSDYVTDKDLSTLGRTVINGGNILTNNLYVNRIWGGDNDDTGYVAVGYDLFGVSLSLHDTDDEEVFLVSKWSESYGSSVENYADICFFGNRIAMYNDNSRQLYFKGNVDFSDANVTGVYARFK